MRRALLVLAIAATAMVGCGSGEERTPAACLVPAGSYVRALDAAPDPVRLAGRTPISECLIKDQPPALLASVGKSMVVAATRLSTRAHTAILEEELSSAKTGANRAAVGLGYLIGAARRGEADTGGIHTDLVRRLEAAAAFPGAGGAIPEFFRRAYDKGYAAGRRSG